MPFCIKCRTELVEGAKFCHNCAAPVPIEYIEISAKREEAEIEIPVVMPEAPPNASTYVISEPVQIPETTEEDRQSLLDKMRKRLLGEIITWRVVSILNIMLIAFMFVAMFSSIAYFAMSESRQDDIVYDESYMSVEASYSSAVEDYDVPASDIWTYFYLGFMLSLYLGLPSAIIGLVVSKKASRCKKQLYNDCSLALRRYGSASVIIIPALFNPLVLIFTIPLFVTVRSNRLMLLEISDMQKKYYGY